MITEEFFTTAYNKLEELLLAEYKERLIQIYTDCFNLLLLLYHWSDREIVNAQSVPDIKALLVWLYAEPREVRWSPQKYCKIVNQIQKNQIIPEYSIQIPSDVLQKGKKYIRDFLEALDIFIKKKKYTESELLNLFSLGYQIMRCRLQLANIGCFTANRIRENNLRRGGLSTTSIYEPQKEEAEKIYFEYKKENLELLTLYNQCQKKRKPNKPITVLKKMLVAKIKAPISDDTALRWAKKLLETDGCLKKRNN
ncbi:MAG: hypothetical protein ACI4OR_02450 [Alphaproteobacteria bacterium]